jgi:hypothetical protein
MALNRRRKGRLQKDKRWAMVRRVNRNTTLLY